MTPLQEAAKAARDKMELPVCKVCNGYGKDTFIHVATCRECGGCGVDVSNPYAIIGRAVCHLSSAGIDFSEREFPNISAACRDADTGCGMRGVSAVHYFERHYHKAPESIAAACLRLVARCSA